jgi:hypothetical protein
MIDYEGNKIVWISEGTLNYSPDHVAWLLEYLEDLKEGRYPVRHKDSGYTGRTRGRKVWYQMKAVMAYIEISRRLAKCGTDRLLVELYYCQGWDVDRIAKYVSKTPEDVIDRIGNVISYISSGDCPRWLECRKCGRFGICRKRKKLRRRTYTYEEWVEYQNRERNRKKGW